MTQIKELQRNIQTDKTNRVNNNVGKIVASKVDKSCWNDKGATINALRQGLTAMTIGKPSYNVKVIEQHIYRLS